MDEFLNLLKAMEEMAKKDAEAPVVMCFCKESGLNGKRSTTVKGPDSAIFAGLCELVYVAIKKNPDKTMQKITMELLFDDVMRKLNED
ncbi:hypothetical protein [Lacrimispora sp. JR3]|uniref:hypothetical protein n=1 Tax=Lacrimispora sinapis TaxID=3111456 RepID=UPI003747CD76